MAQDPSSKELLDAVKQQESGGRRYDKSGNLLEGPQTKYGTAKGEMQVLDMTNKDPGFGVRPARDNSADERARVGEDYLAAMINRYGDRKTALIAYNWGPGNTDTWLKNGADPAKLPAETQNYVAKITGNLGTTKVAQTSPQARPSPKPGMQRVAYSGSPVAHPMLAMLGPNYQAAMAVSMLADEGEKEGKSEYEPSEAEKMLAAAPARPVALAQMDLSYQSPFPEPNTGVAGLQKQPQQQQPIGMAAGGVPYIPISTISPSAKQELETVKSNWDAYNTKATSYNDELAKYVALVDAYNKGPRTTDFTGKEPVAPTQPTVSVEKYQAMAEEAKKDAQNRGFALGVVADPERYGLSMNKFFADGGIVHRAGGSPDTGEYFQDPMGVADSGPVTADTFAKGKDFKAADALQAAKEVGKGMLRSGRAIAQGVSETPYNVVGAPVDIATMAMRPFGYNVQEPTGGSEHLKRLALEAGIRQAPPTDPRDKGFYTMGELGASVVNPGPIAAKGGKAAEMLAKDFQAYNRALGPAGVAYAVKPKNGTFLTSGSLDKPAASKLDKALEVYADRAIQDAPDVETTKAIRDFIDKKARKYFTTEFGTGADPIRTAISSGEIAPIGTDVDMFPEYLLHSARTLEAPGHAVAKRDLERFYDQASGVKGTIIGTHDAADGDARRLFNENVRLTNEREAATMAREGTPVELQNPNTTTETLRDLSSYTYNERLKNAILDNPEQFPAVTGAVERGQPIYDLAYSQPHMDMFSPKIIAENLSVLPPNKLKNMTFADAMIEGSKRMEVYRNYDVAIAKAEKGAAVPKAVLDLFTKPHMEGATGDWKQLTDAKASSLEGALMNHSIGGYSSGNTYGTTYTDLPYGGKKAFDEGLVKIYSLRDSEGKPTVTLEMAKSGQGAGKLWNITQIRGPFNSEPSSHQWDDIFNFIKKDEQHIGDIKSNTYSKDRTGTASPNSRVEWGKAYENWKEGRGPRENEAPNPWGSTQLAKGGMVERQASTARYI